MEEYKKNKKKLTLKNIPLNPYFHKTLSNLQFKISSTLVKNKK